ncbi:MAG: arginine--tRNA ligase, partial [Actinomycetota bacterium]
MGPGPLMGPFESWLATLLDQAILRCSGVEGSVSGVDVSAASKLGEARVSVTLAAPRDADRATWRRLADELCLEPSIERAVAVPPTIHLTLTGQALEAGVALSAVAEPLIPWRAVAVPGTVVVFCSPNTNKPLHIGHLRACFLGMSISRMLEATGIPMARSQMLSNFGIHMCQALAMHDGSHASSSGVKGDHFVGNLYRAYHDALREAADAGCDDAACRAEVGARPCIRCLAPRLL